MAAGTTDTKFLGSTGVATANSTKIYQKYKSVELGDQLMTGGTPSAPKHPSTDDDNLVDENYDEGNDGDGGDDDDDVECW